MAFHRHVHNFQSITDAGNPPGFRFCRLCGSFPTRIIGEHPDELTLGAPQGDLIAYPPVVMSDSVAGMSLQDIVKRNGRNLKAIRKAQRKS